jgi:hypothetical protein
MTLGLAFPARLVSQRPGASPQKVAVAIVQANSQRDWRTILALAHPQALQHYQQQQIDAMGILDRPELRTASVRQREYMRCQIQLRMDSVLRTPTLDSLKKTPADTIFARMLRYGWRSKELPNPFGPSRRTIVGAVIANDSTAYAILEEQFEPSSKTDEPRIDAEVLALRAYHGEWRSMLDDPEYWRGSAGWFESAEALNCGH